MADPFTIQVQRFVDKAKANLAEFCVEFVQDVGEEVVRVTPVKTGFLRGSWWASIGAPNVGPGAPDPGGAGAVARMNLAAVGLQPGEVFFIMNGAAYAGHVEYGTSRMEGRMFVRGTVARAPAIAAATAARIAAS